MAVELESWDRKNFTHGGGEPLLFYVVYGRINRTEPL